MNTGKICALKVRFWLTSVSSVFPPFFSFSRLCNLFQESRRRFSGRRDKGAGDDEKLRVTLHRARVRLISVG
jgi:hypothetical protein